MGSKSEKITKAYQFFQNAERTKHVFSLEDIAKNSGWTIGTVKNYYTKKWQSFLKEVENGLLCNNEFSTISEDGFIRLHSQKTDITNSNILRPRFTPNVDVLIDKARESALLAVQVYNNPLVCFRTPGFVVHMIIAYTALFHAIFEKGKIEYWYKNDNGSPKEIDGDKWAWELTECVKKYYKSENLPEIANIQFFIKIRNKIEHRFVPELDLTFSGKCQAMLMNFESLLIKEFGQFFALGQNLALALQFSTYSAEQWNILKKIQASAYEDIKKIADTYEANLSNEITQSMQYSFRAYLIPKIGNHAKSSDIAIEFIKYDPDNKEDMDKYEKQVAFIKEKTVQVADQGKLRPTDVVEQVRKITGLNFLMHHHTKARKYYNIAPSKVDCKIEYCQFSEPFSQFIYTEKWVNFLADKIRIPEEFERIKSYKPNNT